MKTKSYLHCVVTCHNGRTFENPLMLSEAHLIATMLKDNLKVEISRHTVSVEFYSQIFGK